MALKEVSLGPQGLIESLESWSAQLNVKAQVVERVLLKENRVQVLLVNEAKNCLGMWEGLIVTIKDKSSNPSRSLVWSLGVGRLLEWGAMNSQGMAGKVLVFWDNRVLELTGMEIGECLISHQFKNIKDGFYWVSMGVYGLIVERLREAFREELGAIRGGSLWQGPWCIRADFNVIRFMREQNKASRLCPTMRRFSEVIEDLE